MSESTLYDDGRIACDRTGLLIRRYYPWGDKRILYASIRSIKCLPLGIRRWRLSGAGDLVHWWNYDPDRPEKQIALDIDTGHRIHPTITPNDPRTVERILNEHVTARR
jgi:hypothetical protein